MEVVNKKLHKQDILELLENIHEGHIPTDNERARLARERSMVLYGIQAATLTEGTKYLTGLRNLTLKHISGVLPAEVGQLGSLRKLTISGSLTSIPYTIGRLEQLTHIELRCDALKTLPRSLCNLPKLEHLILFCPNLEELPKQFRQLKTLHTLKLHCRQLRNLEKRLDHLKSLTFLSVEHAMSKALLGAISTLTELETLQLRTEYTVTLPDAVGELHHLRKLILFCAELWLPPGFGRLSRLNELHLRCERLVLPEEMSELTSLTSLTLHASDLSHLPKELFCIPHLQQLSLSCPALEELPDSIGELSELQLLDIFSTKLDVLPPAFLSLKNLRRLVLRSPELKRLPEELGCLTNLQSLFIDATLEQLPHSINGLEKLERFDLISANLEEIPTQIGAMSGLRTLHVSSPQLRTLPVALADLEQLEELILRPCALEKLPDSLGHLTRLSILEISSDNLQLTSDVIRDLNSLRILRLHSKQINTIPDWIANLTMLQVLDFSGCGISVLPTHLAELHGLKQIDLSYTELTVLPDWVGDLSELQQISIDRTKVRELPASLGQLHEMERLQLSGLKLQRLPEELLAYQLPFFLKEPETVQEQGIFLGGTTLSTQPVSLFEQPRALIEEYYSAKQIPVNEAKVIFLGDGSVGKTYTIQRMLNDCAPETEQDRYLTTETHGILIKPYHVERDGRFFDIHFWDFGGQDIMHSMHRCFLTERTCYVVMVSTRTPDLTTGRARYWLRNIESFAHNAPVILAVNRWGVDSPHTGLDTSRLRKEFPNLVDCVYYSAKNSSVEEFRQLERAIVEQAQQLDSCNMSFPEQWDGIRQELLRQATNATYYIGRDQYHRICDKFGLSRHEGIRAWLLEWFNDLGVCFSYHQDNDQKELDDYKILDPEWLTSAVYRIIFGQGKVQNGTITIKEIQRILSEEGSPDLEKKGIPCLNGVSYSGEECNYVLEIMRKFKVSYNVSNKKEFIPALCSENTPVDLEPKEQIHWGSVKLNYHYLPDSVVHQLMISCHDLLQQDKCWRRGLFLDMDNVGLSFGSWSGCSAAIYMTGGHSEDTDLQIDLYQKKDTPEEHPNAVLRLLLKLIKRINQTMNLQADLLVLAKKNGASEWFLFRKILKCQDRGFLEMQGEDENYEIADLLRKYNSNDSISLGSTGFLRDSYRFYLEDILVRKSPFSLNSYDPQRTFIRNQMSVLPLFHEAPPHLNWNGLDISTTGLQSIFKEQTELNLHSFSPDIPDMNDTRLSPALIELLRTDIRPHKPIKLEYTVKGRPISDERKETAWKKTKKRKKH